MRVVLAGHFAPRGRPYYTIDNGLLNGALELLGSAGLARTRYGWLSEHVQRTGGT